MTAGKPNSLFTAALLGTIAINMVLFLFIPLLSSITNDDHSQSAPSAFTFNTLRHAPPPPPTQEHKKQPPQLRELPKAPPAQAARPKQMKTLKTPQITAPQPQFEAAMGDLGLGGMAFTPVGAPQSEFDISQVDTMPQVISRREPIYPYSARQKQISGMVILKFLVSPQGAVQQISVVQSNPANIFDEAAIQAVSHWHFKPGMLDQAAVATWITVPIQFTLN